MRLSHIRDHRVLLALLGLVLALVATEAWAVVLYKLTDASGHVTYVDRLPRGFTGEVERLDIDTSRSVRIAPPEPGIVIERSAPPVIADAREARVRQARARLAAARNELLTAQEASTAEDWIYFGPGRGRAPRPEYQARLERLETNVRQAEEDLRAAERG